MWTMTDIICQAREVLKWAREEGCPWDANSTCSAALKGGDAETLRWMREETAYFGIRCNFTASLDLENDINNK